MPINSRYLANLESGRFYHVFNRANGQNILFGNSENYLQFLKKYDRYFSDFAEMYAYCLLSNHFHFLIRIKEQEEWAKNEKYLVFRRKYPEKTQNDFLIKQMQDFFISYAMSFNIEHKRKGGLFMHPFKRIEIDSDSYFSRMIYYIHRNPVHHRITSDFQHYAWSSYRRILTDKPTKLQKKAVLDWFGGKEDYIKFHLKDQDLEGIRHLIMEE